MNCWYVAYTKVGRTGSGDPGLNGTTVIATTLKHWKLVRIPGIRTPFFIGYDAWICQHLPTKKRVSMVTQQAT
jgi:hypothetical protein